MVETLPYGSWPSPVTAAWASGASPRIDGAASDGVQGLPASISATTVVAVRRFSISLDE